MWGGRSSDEWQITRVAPTSSIEQGTAARVTVLEA
jgi:hypothetical protein